MQTTEARASDWYWLECSRENIVQPTKCEDHRPTLQTFNTHKRHAHKTVDSSLPAVAYKCVWLFRSLPEQPFQVLRP
jgi:hypothetical protein